jgi:CRISPR/Cas system CSM-associated protein Csm2 small subunit
VKQKKENSVKSAVNRMMYMQNSLTYLNQRTFESFVELLKEGGAIEDSPAVSGGTDI